MSSILIRVALATVLAITFAGAAGAQQRLEWQSEAAYYAPKLPDVVARCSQCAEAARILTALRRQVQLHTVGKTYFEGEIAWRTPALANLVEELRLLNLTISSGAPLDVDANARRSALNSRIHVMSGELQRREQWLNEINEDLPKYVAEEAKRAAILADCEKSWCTPPKPVAATPVPPLATPVPPSGTPPAPRPEVTFKIQFGGVIGAGNDSPVDIFGGAERIFPGGGLFIGFDGRLRFPDSPVGGGVGLLFTPLGPGEIGGFGSSQAGKLLDGRFRITTEVLRVMRNEPPPPGPPAAAGKTMTYQDLISGRPIFDASGGVAVAHYKQTSTGAGGASRHESFFTGAGPFLQLDLMVPIANGLPGDGVLFVYGGLSGGPLFGGINETSTYGVSGGHSRTVWNINGQAGIAFMLPNGLSIGGEAFYRRYSGVADGTLNSSTIISDVTRTIFGVTARLSYSFGY